MAQKLAQQIGMNYHEVEIKTSQMVQDFPEMIYFLDDPIADIAAYGYYQVSRAAQKQGVPVLLNGIGGDELFGGYFWSRRAITKTLQKHRYQQTKKLNIFNVISSCLDQPKESGTPFWKHILANYKIEKDKITLNPHRFVFYEEMPGFLKSSETLKQLYSSNFLKGIDPETIYTPFTSNDWSNPPLQNMQALFNTWLYSNCIALGDRMSMAHSVELRLPFMDHKLVETVVGINKYYPQEYKMPHKQRFIKAIRHLLPQEIFKRKKRGFTPPTQDWILALVHRYSGFLKEGYLVKEGIMDSEKLENFMNDAKEKKSNLFFAHKLILMEIWCRIYLYHEDYRNIRPQP
jgi:asparagine synthase (glutamine-hydrolysing)